MAGIVGQAAHVVARSHAHQPNAVPPRTAQGLFHARHGHGLPKAIAAIQQRRGTTVAYHLGLGSGLNRAAAHPAEIGRNTRHPVGIMARQIGRHQQSSHERGLCRRAARRGKERLGQRTQVCRGNQHVGCFRHGVVIHAQGKASHRAGC